MTDLVPFSFESRPIRVLSDSDGEPWFVARDVADALGYSNTNKAVIDHCKRAKALKDMGVTNRDPLPNQSLTLDPQTKLIPEGDVYRLIARSKLPSAEAFESLVMDEILPAIRKTGRYEAPGQAVATPPALPAPDPLPVEVRRSINRRANALAHPTFLRLRDAIESAVRRHAQRFPHDPDLAQWASEVEPFEDEPDRGPCAALAAAHRELLRLNPRWDVLRRCLLAGLTLEQTALALGHSPSWVGKEKQRMAECGMLESGGALALGVQHG